jgi:hypothetical protein
VDEQRQRSVRGLELVPFVLERFDALEHRVELRRIGGDVEPELARLHDDVAPAGELADQHLAAVADERRIAARRGTICSTPPTPTSKCPCP